MTSIDSHLLYSNTAKRLGPCDLSDTFVNSDYAQDVAYIPNGQGGVVLTQLGLGSALGAFEFAMTVVLVYQQEDLSFRPYLFCFLDRGPSARTPLSGRARGG